MRLGCVFHVCYVIVVAKLRALWICIIGLGGLISSSIVLSRPEIMSGLLGGDFCAGF